MQNIQGIINSYVESAINHGNSTMQGDSKLANKSYDEIIKNIKNLRTFGDEGNLKLEKLLKHDNESVRLWAATHSLKCNEKQAKSTLGSLAKSEGILSFNAEMVIIEWNAGRLDIP